MAADDGLADELAVEDHEVSAAPGGKVGKDLIMPLRDRHAAHLDRRVRVVLHELAQRLAGLPCKPDDLEFPAGPRRWRGGSFSLRRLSCRLGRGRRLGCGGHFCWSLGDGGSLGWSLCAFWSSRWHRSRGRL